MPGTTDGKDRLLKRKHEDNISKPLKTKKRAVEDNAAQEDDIQSQVLLLEERIRKSRKNYNSISTLLGYARSVDDGMMHIAAAEALYRVFRRLMAAGSLVKSQVASENEAVVVKWLKERYQDYKVVLLQLLEQADNVKQSMALTLLLRLVKGEKAHVLTSDDAVWRTGLFAKVIRALLADTTANETREEFAKKYLGKFDDIRYHTFERLAQILLFDSSETILQNTLSLLTSVEMIPQQQDQLKHFFVDPPNRAKHDLHSLTAHKKQAQKAWMAVFRNNLSKSQRKTVLVLMSHRIAPWFLNVELLMDFLTDSFNLGGSSSLMALSGLFYLIQHKNLDYPQFYQKLYSLLDSNILHSKHRSDFFRLLDTFLASTHLPAALVASFIKRLSRLSLHAPPSAIVVVVPWIYNLLKNHPTCTFMIHRKADIDLDKDRWGDPFLMEETDPAGTDALESSLWEIYTLQTHYHPNVASIAKIISEQFTKHAYNLEDFLDHSYGTMLDAELSKSIKKPPEIEYEIPKRIFLRQDAESGKEDSLLVKLWEFS